jgi:glycosyltransferase involved in cell wall biosynthesis
LTDIPFNNRNRDFVCMGRISEEKRIERVLEILTKVRDRGHQARLRLVGGFGRDTYARKIETLVRGLSWVALEGAVSEQRKAGILASSRYGIHGAEGEGFGIAIAEMVKAGCVTFAPAEGGSAEILDHEALLYRGNDDAVEKIIAVLSNEPLRWELSAHLRRQADKFSAEKFMSGLREAIERFIQQRKSAVSSNPRILAIQSAAS